MVASLLKQITLASLVVAAYAAPTQPPSHARDSVGRAGIRGQPPVRRQETGGTVGGSDGDVVSDTPVGPPGASGSLRGPVSLGGYSSGNPVSSPDTVIPADQYTLASGQTADTDLGLYLDLNNIENPQPIRGAGGKSPTDPGPRNRPLDVQNSDLFAPPGTDAGSIKNAKWPMGLSHNRPGKDGAGWARQENTDVLPVATALAGVNMRLEPNSYRELHWHSATEWAYILNGTVRVSSINEAGESFVDDLQAGDLWLFPSGSPHSIQSFEEGVEFLLVFDDGSFSEDETFLITELMMHTPKSVLAKDLRVDTSAFDNIPKEELYIFEGTPAPKNISEQHVTGPAGVIPQSGSYSYHWSQQQAYEVPGGSLKIADSKNFPASTNFAAALFTVKPGAMRELHWHVADGQKSGDEWSFFIQGQARATIFQGPSSARTFDFQAGDVGYVPSTFSHYIENVGDEDLVYLEILQSSVFNDISVAQWLGLTPKQIVKDHLGLSDDTLNRLPMIKPYILPGSTNKTQTNFTSEAE